MSWGRVSKEQDSRGWRAKNNHGGPQPLAFSSEMEVWIIGVVCSETGFYKAVLAVAS